VHGSVANHKDDDCRLNIFQMTIRNRELAKELVIKELLDFRRFHVDVKNIKTFLLWWENHHSRFLVVGLLARHILGIVGFQIGMEDIFSLVGILINLRRCHLQLENLEKLIFVSRN
jgi:hypothetical protein